MKKPIVIYEYDELKETQIERINFDTLKRFVLEDNGSNEPKNILSLGIKGNTQFIKANNYVGAITFKDGTTIEILPKIGKKMKKDENTEKSCKELLKTMLSASLDIPFKKYEDTNLERIQRHPFEFFIRAFIDKLERILNEGIASKYFDVEGNETFIKGRINFSNNIRFNHSHTERVYVEYQLFGNNTPANRIIKTTVELLYGITNDPKNRSDLNRIRTDLEEVPPSVDIDLDFDSIIIDRNMGLYPEILKWCEVFLHSNALSTFHGSTVAFSFLFPMDRLYETYVAKEISKRYHDRYVVKIQRGGKFLFNTPANKFYLKPDVILESREDPNHIVIVDTKWKLITNENEISQADIYQMFAYSKRFKSKRTILLYPGTESLGWEYKIDDVDICASFIDLSADRIALCLPEL